MTVVRHPSPQTQNTSEQADRPTVLVEPSNPMERTFRAPRWLWAARGVNRLDENRFFDQPTGGHVSMTPRQLRQGSAQIESILRRSQAIQYAQSQSTATDDLMWNVMQVRLCVLKAPTPTSLIRGSIYGRKNCFSDPFRDKYIPSDYKILHPTFLNDAINLPSSAECKH